jgi:hypothetical protein
MADTQQFVALVNAIRGRESSGNPDAQSPQGARGSMQIMPDTFKQYADANWSFDNEQQRNAAAIRKLADDYSFYGGDVRKTAAAYLGGRGAVLADGTIRSDVRDSLGTTPAAYSDQVASRMGLGASGPSAEQLARVNARREPAQSTAGWKDLGEIKLFGTATPAAPDAAKPGLWGDIKTSLNLGVQGLAQDAREIARKTLGDGFVAAVDSVDEMLHGKKSEELLRENIQRSQEALTPEMRSAMEKKWWNSDTNSFGDAFTDPRAYLGGVVQSIPGTVITMLPGAILARGMYVTRMAAAANAAREGGLVGEAASAFLSDQAKKEAARAATASQIAGSIGEGLQGGAQSSREVRDAILAMTSEQLQQQSDAYRILISQGLSPEDARARMANDASTQAFITAGVVTGAFGGAGDRMLATGITTGLKGNIAKRVAKGAVSEGLLEEFPQSYGSQVAQNVAMQRADPNVSATDDAMNQGLGGLAVGAAMGGGMAAPFKEHGHAATPQPEAAPSLATQGTAMMDAAAPAEAAPQPAVAPADGLTARVAAVTGLMKDKLAMRDIRGQDPEAYQEFLRAYRIALNPSMDSLIRKRALDDIDGYLQRAGMAPRSAIENPPAVVAQPDQPAAPAASPTPALPAPDFDPSGTLIADAAGNVRPAYVGDVPQTLEGQVVSESTQPVPPQPAFVADAQGNVDRPAAMDLFAEHSAQAQRLRTALGDQPAALPAPAMSDEQGASLRRVSPLVEDVRRLRKQQGVPDVGLRGRDGGMGAGGDRLGSGDALGGMGDRGDVRDGSVGAGGLSPAAATPESSGGADSPAGTGGRSADAVIPEATQQKLRDLAQLVGQPEGEAVRRYREALASRGQEWADKALDNGIAKRRAPVDAAAHEAATSPENGRPEPSQAQKEAGNYKLGHAKVAGFDVSIENPQGSARSGTDRDGKPWSVTMKSHYGNLRRTEGADGDHVDTFVKPGTEAEYRGPVFVIDQVHPDTGKFDEHKVMLGWRTETGAVKAYRENYARDWKGLGKVTQMTHEQFRNWLKSGDTTKPAALPADAPQPKAKPQEATRSEQRSDRIDDVGEKLGGARKDVWRQFSASLNTPLPEELSEISLAKHFPEPNYEAALKDGASMKTLAAVRALREQIPSKPRSEWKLKRWVEDLKFMRTFAGSLIDGKLSIDRLLTALRQSQGFGRVADRIELYAELGYPDFTKAADLSVRGGRFTILGGVEYPKGKTAYVVSEKAQHIGYFDTQPEAIKAVRDRISKQTPAARGETQLDIYRVTRTGDVVIGKKVGPGKYIDLKGGFKRPAEASSYLKENREELLKLLDERKEVPPERRSVNDPRVGEDYRKGANVAPEDFRSTFGFRGVEFGNYVEQGKRQRDINNAFDALTDLANVLGVPPKALSLNGELGLAFGARGRGGKNAAAAHYEADYVAINLTKLDGAGSLAHEWFHALDNYFSRGRGRGDDFLTNNPRQVPDDTSIRPEVLQAFEGVVKAIWGSGLPRRSRELDQRRAKDYWSTTIEMAARAFESYIIDKARERGVSNDYLANIMPERDYGESGSYPYPTRKDAETINPAFDRLFKTLETRETEKGTALYSRKGGDDAASKLSVADVRRLSPESLRSLIGSPKPLSTIDTVRGEIGAEVGATKNSRVRVVQSWMDLPTTQRAEVFSQAAFDVQGMFDPDTGAMYLVADNIDPGAAFSVLMHEAGVHAGLKPFIGEQNVAALVRELRAWAAVDADTDEGRLARAALDRIPSDTPAEHIDEELVAYFVEEAVAAGHGTPKPQGGGAIQRWFAKLRSMIREALRKLSVTPKDLKVDDIVALARGALERTLAGGKAERIYRASDTRQSRADELSRLVMKRKLGKGDTKLTAAMTAIAEFDANFQRPTPFGSTVPEITKEIDPGFTVKALGPSLAQEKGVKRMWEIFPTGSTVRSGYLFDDGKRVWVDVSRLISGKDAGNAIYAIAAGYAHNNGKLFVGDPAGLSPMAWHRRLENMISSALKFGTTDHLEPHEAQIDPKAYYADTDEEWAKTLRAIDWEPGNTPHNLKEMLYTSYKAAIDAVPKLKDVIYDFNRGEFIDSGTGDVLDDRALRALVSGDVPKSGQRYRGGSSTAKRAALVNTLLREQGEGGGRRVLDSLVDQLRSGRPQLRLKDTFYSRSGKATHGPAFDFFIAKHLKLTKEEVPSWAGDLPAHQQDTLRKVGLIHEQPTLAGRVREAFTDFRKKFVQGVFDQYAPLKDLDQRAYMLARMSNASDGGLEAMLFYGKPELDDGVLDVKVGEGGGFIDALNHLEGEHDRFFAWVAGKRAGELKTAGKENLLTGDDISFLGKLNEGKMPDGTARELAYAKALGKLREFNKATLDIAEKSGLIDGESRHLWESEFYVPFYRVMEEGIGGPSIKSGLVGQQAFKKLRGGTHDLNDLFANTLTNWSHLLSASAKNRAALESMKAAVRAGVAEEVAAGTKGAVKVMEGGEQKHYAISDPYVADAVMALEWAGFGPIMKPFQMFKHFLTAGVTISPTFKVANLLRDSIAAIGQAPVSYNPLDNLAKGWQATYKGSQTYVSMLASGGMFRMGTSLEADRAKHAKRLVQAGIKEADILDTKDKVRALFAKTWDAYNELGDRSENINRGALYTRMREGGAGKLESAFASRDLMDFGLQGKWAIVRFLTQVVPFMNARLQGLYKLGRAANDDRARFAYVVGAVAAASLALMLLQQDDDDWKKREDWDRDAYWWVKLGDHAVRIPKPFEIGSLGTLAERTWELAFNKEMDAKRYGARIGDMLANTFAMSPVPQLVKPLVDIYANQDSFTGRRIETLGMERLQKKDRIGQGTSEAARILGAAGLPDPLQLLQGRYESISPVQMDALMKGYFGTLAIGVNAGLDMLLRPLMGRADRADQGISATPVVGRFLRDLPEEQSRYVTQLYDRAAEIEQVYASYRDALKRGDKERAAEISADEGDKLRQYRSMEAAKRGMGNLNTAIRKIEDDRTIDPEEKKNRIDKIKAMQDRLARHAEAAI